ncbi:ABC transporter permease subunit [Rhodobacterales bacterium HKCCE3408]|nr:ABC transporter permease subunit [Rhodobacterales bacterium HKCCE3408]
MDMLSWTGNLGPILNPLMLAAAVVFILGFLGQVILSFAGIRPGEVVINPDRTMSVVRTPSDYMLMAMKYAVLLFLTCCVVYIFGGIVQPELEDRGILGQLGRQFLPVWIALIVLYAVSIVFKRRLGLYGKLFDNPIGMVGFGLVMFWIFTAVFSTLVATHGPIDVISQMRNELPGTYLPSGEEGEFPVYLLGGDSLGRDVFSRMVYGAVSVLRIAPLATLFAFMVGVSLGLPAGYFGGKIDTIVSFIANLVLAFPVILLFYLLVTPEIVAAGIPVAMAAVLFIFPILFFVVLFNSRFHTQQGTRNILVAIVLIVGFWLYFSLLSDPDPDSPVRFVPSAIDVIDIPGNLLIVFVSVVFVNSPTVFRIVRGIVLDVQTRDYVAAAQTRGEGPWYIMLWEILPNARGPLIVDFCLRIGYTTILLGTLGFFGLGVSPESPDWGSTINDGRRLLTVYPHPPLPPALALMTLVLGLNLLADGLREESLKD